MTPLRYVYGVDPGTTGSALVIYDLLSRRIEQHRTASNEEILDQLRADGSRRIGFLVVEQIESMGMAVGAETFETVWWAGRFHQAWTGAAHRVTRRQVKLHLCGSMRAKDPNIRQALLDRFGGSAAIGKKATPGPLYGVKGHEFAALAVGITFIDLVLPVLHKTA
jgi:hypothetical protein